MPAREVLQRPSRWDRIKAWFWADPRPPPRCAPIGTVEPPEPGVVGICCSGGGIRSAAFNLGALQRLQSEGVLARADYLAAVSGGSYIASAFSMVSPVRREPPLPAEEDPFGPGFPKPFAAGSPEEQYLRNRTGYMAPNGMAKVVFLWRLLIGALATFLLIATPVALIAFGLSEIVFAPLYYDDVTGELDVPDVILWFVGVLLPAAAIVVGLFSMGTRRVREENGWEIWAGRLITLALGLGAVFVGLPYLRDWFAHIDLDPGAEGLGLGLSAATLTFVGGVLALMREILFAPADKGTSKGSGRLRVSPAIAKRLRLALAYAAGAVAGPLLIVAFAYAAFTLPLNNEIDSWLLWLIVLTLIYAVVYREVDLTALSLHRVYKKRLCSAFALRRGIDGGAIEAEERPFRERVKLSETAFRGGEWPTLIVCAAANVSDGGATPRGRNVTTFTFSPKAVGGPLVGAIGTEVLERGFQTDRRSRDVTLAAAIAMSGAALAPSMGKLTRKPFRFLLALANVRLGVWVPNPSFAQRRAAKNRAHDRESEKNESGDVKQTVAERVREEGYGRPRVTYLFRELIGRNYLDSPYLYVTDGGHYENLGLVELLRRGCTEIYCFDASGGHDGGELGDAIALARNELQVEVQIDPSGLFAEEPPDVACEPGDVTFGRADGQPDVQGRLYYCKNVMRGDASWDVKAVASRDPGFPDHSTGEQLYTEQRFEAYRKLGWEAARQAIDMHRAYAAPAASSQVTEAELTPSNGAAAVASPPAAGP